jgi:hypothetical protein
MHNSQMIIIAVVHMGRTVPTASILTASTHAQMSSPAHLFFLFTGKKHKVPLHCLQHPQTSCIQRQPFQLKNSCIQSTAASGKVTYGGGSLSLRGGGVGISRIINCTDKYDVICKTSQRQFYCYTPILNKMR